MYYLCCIKLDVSLCCCIDTFHGMSFLFQQDNPKLLSAGTLYSFATHMSATELVKMCHSWTSPALLSAHNASKAFTEKQRRGLSVKSLCSFEISVKSVSNLLPTSPGVQPSANRQVYSRAVPVECQTFVSYVGKKKKKKKKDHSFSSLSCILSSQEGALFATCAYSA